MPVETRIVFKISNTFHAWAQAFDKDRANQEAAVLKTIFRAVNETDSSRVMVILEAEPLVLGKYIEGNLDVEASDHILLSEEYSNFLA